MLFQFVNACIPILRHKHVDFIARPFVSSLSGSSGIGRHVNDLSLCQTKVSCQPRRGRIPGRGDREQWVCARVEKEQKKLAKRIASKRYRQSLHSWEEELQSRQFRKLTDKLSTRDIQKNVEHRLRMFNRRTAELLHDAPDEDIHNLRKLLKRIRYLMELDIEKDDARRLILSIGGLKSG